MSALTLFLCLAPFVAVVGVLHGRYLAIETYVDIFYGEFAEAYNEGWWHLSELDDKW